MKSGCGTSRRRGEDDTTCPPTISRRSKNARRERCTGVVGAGEQDGGATAQRHAALGYGLTCRNFSGLMASLASPLAVDDACFSPRDVTFPAKHESGKLNDGRSASRRGRPGPRRRDLARLPPPLEVGDHGNRRHARIRFSVVRPASFSCQAIASWNKPRVGFAERVERCDEITTITTVTTSGVHSDSLFFFIFF